MLRNEIGWFDLDENSSGALASRLATDATLVRSTLADRLSTLVQNISLTVTAFIIAFILSWRMAAVVVATFPLLICAGITEQLFLKGFGGNLSLAYTKANSLAQEAITNIRTVAAFGTEEHLSVQFASELHKPSKQAFAHGHISGMGYGISQLFAFCSYALGLWYASHLVEDHTSNIGCVMKSFMVLIITALSIAETLALAPDIVKGSQALTSVFSIIDRKTAIDPTDPNSTPVSEIAGDISFNDVTFHYPTRPELQVLQNLTLPIPAGTTVAIIGPSGSGKSSIISLLIRFYDPTTGTIHLDGADIRTLNLKSLSAEGDVAADCGGGERGAAFGRAEAEGGDRESGAEGPGGDGDGRGDKRA